MKFKSLIVSNTLPSLYILSEEKISAFIKNCENRYINNFRCSRKDAANFYKSKNIKDKMLSDNNNYGISKEKFRRLTILEFDKSKRHISREDFINILDNYLLNYSNNGYLL